MSFVNAGLEIEVEIGQEFSCREFGFGDSSFDPPLDQIIGFKSEYPIQKRRNGEFFLEGGGQLTVKILLDLQKVQRPEVAAYPLDLR